MKTETWKRLEAAYELINIQKQRDLMWELISKYYIDENMTLKEILEQTSARKNELCNIIDGNIKELDKDKLDSIQRASVSDYVKSGRMRDDMNSFNLHEGNSLIQGYASGFYDGFLSSISREDDWRESEITDLC